MKLHLTPGVLAFGLATLIPAAAQKDGAAEKPAEAAAEPAAPKVDPAKVKPDSSYGFGFKTGGQFMNQYGQYGLTAEDVDPEAFLKGFIAGIKGEKPGTPEADLQAALGALGDLIQKREKEMGAKNLEAGTKFLEENKKKDGIVTTASGLQYQVLAKGGDKKYAEPKEGEPEKQFMVNYKGTVIDGTEFDASPPGQPVPMTLQVIPGWVEALKMMPIGAKWKLFIPSALAYGDSRRSNVITPNSVLIFELELVDIKDAPADPHGGLPFQIPGADGGEGQ
ncbi:FKBP-type peptidyl-prolyl cis-trans isomerase N-terminal domain-containing protein [Haloferula sp. BvORR071]|uniref:FKBP-type peptidyl-prolyl cis-trans isomerase N-terminal domain-containing protein n=1 Tax=Haloferula sp. BvORR071 TaxID=1396141 RepID=UPI0006990CBC|nr:FKBP-type peptidyl-prolyl cis-trans isomerase N-terminal domain-containing protein [Haloferula sp. BvORR071]